MLRDLLLVEQDEHRLDTINVNENTFWDFVDEVNWYENTKQEEGYALKYMNHVLTSNFSIDEIAELQRIEVAKRLEMENYLKSYINSLPKTEREQYQNIDMITTASQVVGMGKTMFAYVKDNPQTVLTMQRNLQYCFEDGFDNAIYNFSII